MNKVDKINEGIVDLKERKLQMTEDNIHKLELVKEILMLGKTDLMTVQMVANYFEVDIKTIDKLINRHMDELLENGMIIVTGKEFKDKFVKSLENITNYRGYFEYNGQKFANRTNRLINKRTLACIGLILKDSPIAIEYRRKLGIINNPNPRKEIKFIELLEDILKPFGIKGVKQFEILNYRLDYYITDYNLVIEYDENEHKQYNQEKENKREEEIKRELFDEITNIPCTIIRVSDKNSNGYNCGLIIKEILNMKKKSDVLFERIEILEKVKNILNDNKEYSLEELSNIFKISEIEIFKIIPKNKNITKKEVYELSLELIDNEIAKELRKRLLSITMMK